VIEDEPVDKGTLLITSMIQEPEEASFFYEKLRNRSEGIVNQIRPLEML